jgi:hypothetical protein
MRLPLVMGMTSLLWLAGSATGQAQEAPNQRILGNYVCLNNPAPECRNPERRITPVFACINNPNPECRHPPRPRTELRPGTWSCRMNQNVNCGNTIRYSVENLEEWAEHFEERSGDGKR